MNFQDYLWIIILGLILLLVILLLICALVEGKKYKKFEDDDENAFHKSKTINMDRWDSLRNQKKTLPDKFLAPLEKDERHSNVY